MLAAKGMWYQRESKLKMPRSRACLVVTAQWKTTIATTAVVTTRDQARWRGCSGPAGPVTASGGPASGDFVSVLGPPEPAPPTGRSHTARAIRVVAATRAPG